MAHVDLQQPSALDPSNRVDGPGTGHPSGPADPPLLRPVLDARWALRAAHIPLCFAFAILFLYLNRLPLWHTDLWGHVAYGKQLLAQGRIPTEDPFMPLAEGMAVIDSAWLSQVVLAQVHAWGGAQGLANLFSVAVLATALILFRVFYLQSKHLGLAMLGIFVFLLVGWTRLPFIRPEVFASLCFAALLWMVTERRPRSDTIRARSHAWVGVPLLFALWANLHGSFICGIAVLACHATGRGIELLWRHRSAWAVLSDARWRRWVMLAELAAAATLINPYGVDLWFSTLLFSGNANLASLLEWQPLVLYSANGFGFALAWILLGAALRHSQRRVHVADVLLLALFSIATVMSVRMIAWYAPVVAVVLMPHLRDIADQLRRRRATTPAPVQQEVPGSAAGGVSWFPTLTCVLVVWMSFAFSGLSRPVLGGAPRRPEHLYSRHTPRDLTHYLREHPPQGQVWNPQVWGDWLVVDGPSGMRLFATSNVHLIPHRVWNDYLRVYSAHQGWQATLDRYRVRTVVIDRVHQTALAGAIRQESSWTLSYEDALSLVYRRRSVSEKSGQFIGDGS